MMMGTASMQHSVNDPSGIVLFTVDKLSTTTLSPRKPIQKVYFWPSLTQYEREVLRDAFFQIGRRTCVQFQEQEYKPWFHADRWVADQPYVLIRKSKKYAGW
ncbi:hypothetical protein OESDEN_09896 [Oesophagostomum dentatum]|uniref:Peptidase M12A domain-containing protein n=1 Tax=Oesophagostomum dentatum TaxID=61180 RepID=A0A0B1SZ59_OESDE|nr:hypothetical protein OESDEN_09896 [Oesophagostomum dentatum]